MAITSNEYDISSIVASSVMGHSGDGIFPLTLRPSYRRLRRVIRATGTTVITMSTTLEKYDDNFCLYKPRTWEYLQSIEYSGLLNACGFTNAGVEANVAKISRAIKAGFQVIPSVYPQFTKGQDEATRETIRAIGVIFFRHCPNVKVLELNLAGPSSDEKIPENLEKILVCVKDIRLSFPSLCLIGKISITHPHEFVQELVNTGIDIIHAISSIPHDIVFPDSLPSPLAAVGGGRVSGGPASGPAFAYNKSLRKKINVPMIMGCGVIDLDDAKKYFSVGANAVSICSACHLNLEGAIKILEHYAA